MSFAYNLPSPTVNFMIIGAQKCGTSALAHYLEQHPDICMAWGKEVHLFDLLAPVVFQPERIDRFYRGYFSHYQGEVLIGEATPAYCYFPQAMAHLQRYNPELKLIMLMRDPIERALSHYAMERNLKRETLSVDAALLLEPLRRLTAKLLTDKQLPHQLFRSYIDRSRYRRQLKRLYQYFPPKQVLILHALQLSQQHEQTLRAVYTFLELAEPTSLPKPSSVRQTERKYQPAKITCWWLHWLLRHERRWLRERFPQCSQ